MKFDINYNNFKQDCKETLEPFLSQFHFSLINNESEDFINVYSNHSLIIEASMLDLFPFISFNISFFDKNYYEIKRYDIDEYYNIDEKSISIFYKNFSENFDMNEYKNQIRFEVLVLEKFYKDFLIKEW